MFHSNLTNLIKVKFIVALIGISRSAKGYSIILVLETMKTFSVEDGLTEEALVTKLRTCHYHHLLLHTSLRRNSSGLYMILSFILCTI